MNTKNLALLALFALQATPAFAQSEINGLISIGGARLHMPTENLLIIGFDRRKQEITEFITFTKELPAKGITSHPPNYMEVVFSVGDTPVEPDIVYNLQLKAFWGKISPVSVGACIDLASGLSTVVYGNANGEIQEVERKFDYAASGFDVEAHYDWVAHLFSDRIHVEATCQESEYIDGRNLVASITVVDSYLEGVYRTKKMAKEAILSLGLEGVVD